MDYSDYDYIVGPGGETGQWVRPSVNNGAFYDYGTWVDLTLEDDIANIVELDPTNDLNTAGVRKDSNGTVFTRGAPFFNYDDVTLEGGLFLRLCSLPTAYAPEHQQVINTIGYAMGGSGIVMPIPIVVSIAGPDTPGEVDTGDVVAQITTHFPSTNADDDGVAWLEQADVLAGMAIAINLYGQYPTANRPSNQA